MIKYSRNYTMGAQVALAIGTKGLRQNKAERAQGVIERGQGMLSFFHCKQKVISRKMLYFGTKVNMESTYSNCDILNLQNYAVSQLDRFLDVESYWLIFEQNLVM